MNVESLSWFPNSPMGSIYVASSAALIFITVLLCIYYGFQFATLLWSRLFPAPDVSGRDVQGIRFRRIYKYMLDEDLEEQTLVMRTFASHPRNSITSMMPESCWVRLTPDGKIAIRQGYSWDGASGPAIDTPSFMRASLVHDALYQLIEVGQLKMCDRKEADQTLRELCKRAGMGWLRRWYVYQAVRMFGGFHIRSRRNA